VLIVGDQCDNHGAILLTVPHAVLCLRNRSILSTYREYASCIEGSPAFTRRPRLEDAGTHNRFETAGFVTSRCSGQRPRSRCFCLQHSYCCSYRSSRRQSSNRYPWLHSEESTLGSSGSAKGAHVAALRSVTTLVSAQSVTWRKRLFQDGA